MTFLFGLVLGWLVGRVAAARAHRRERDRLEVPPPDRAPVRPFANRRRSP